MNPVVMALLEGALELAFRVLGDAEARRVTAERVEIIASRVAADTEAAAKFGQVPPP